MIERRQQMMTRQNFNQVKKGLTGRVCFRFSLCCLLVLSAHAQSATLEGKYLISQGLAHDVRSEVDGQGPFYFGLEVAESYQIAAAPETAGLKAGAGFAERHQVVYRLATIESLDEFSGPQDLSTWSAQSLDGLAAQLEPGGKYILEMTCEKSACPNVGEEITVSEVPLPATFWLFGSALIGFVMLSNKRVIQ